MLAGKAEFRSLAPQNFTSPVVFRPGALIETIAGILVEIAYQPLC